MKTLALINLFLLVVNSTSPDPNEQERSKSLLNKLLNKISNIYTDQGIESSESIDDMDNRLLKSPAELARKSKGNLIPSPEIISPKKAVRKQLNKEDDYEIINNAEEVQFKEPIIVQSSEEDEMKLISPADLVRNSKGNLVQRSDVILTSEKSDKEVESIPEENIKSNLDKSNHLEFEKTEDENISKVRDVVENIESTSEESVEITKDENDDLVSESNIESIETVSDDSAEDIKEDNIIENIRSISEESIEVISYENNYTEDKNDSSFERCLEAENSCINEINIDSTSATSEETESQEDICNGDINKKDKCMPFKNSGSSSAYKLLDKTIFAYKLGQLNFALEKSSFKNIKISAFNFPIESYYDLDFNYVSGEYDAVEINMIQKQRIPIAIEILIDVELVNGPSVQPSVFGAFITPKLKSEFIKNSNSTFTLKINENSNTPFITLRISKIDSINGATYKKLNVNNQYDAIFRSNVFLKPVEMVIDQFEENQVPKEIPIKPVNNPILDIFNMLKNSLKPKTVPFEEIQKMAINSFMVSYFKNKIPNCKESINLLGSVNSFSSILLKYSLETNLISLDDIYSKPIISQLVTITTEFY